jgi:hypothetical protein
MGGGGVLDAVFARNQILPNKLAEHRVRDGKSCPKQPPPEEIRVHSAFDVLRAVEDAFCMLTAPAYINKIGN